jgi:calcineurin-like phosphoesterase
MVLEVGDHRLGVLNLIGSVGLAAARSPFEAVEEELAALAAEGPDAVLVDFHAEVTSEKVAMGWNLDGRVAAVLGTHTHVPTADGRVLPKGTAFISDVGMTGARESVIGVRIEDALGQFRSQIHSRYRSAEQDPWINAVVIEIGRDGMATSLEQVLEPAR